MGTSDLSLVSLATALLLPLTACDASEVDRWDDPAELVPNATHRNGQGTFSPLSFADNPGGLNAYLYVPATAPAGPAPLVVAMHACSQNATTYRAAGWESLADEMGFYVLYPEQTSANNQLTCFNWAGEYGDPTNLARGQGENQSIISMIDAVKSAHAIDDSQIFASGHSGGGAQVALMLATWPDVFAGGGIFAGIPYHCTTVYNEVSTCLSPGIDKPAATHAQFVLDAYPAFMGDWPKLSIWHGTADTFVSPMNQTELLEQWGTVHGIDLEPDEVETVGAGARAVYHNASGEPVIETWSIMGGGHSTFNSPSEGCGSAGLYFEDRGLCGARYMADFWNLGEPQGGDDSGGDDSAGDDSGADGSSGGGDDDGSGNSGGGDSAGDDDGGGDSAGDDDGSGNGGSGDDGDGDTDGGAGAEDEGEVIPPACSVAETGTPRTLWVWLGLAFAFTRRRRRV